ncbi:MAG: DUF975 family protein [Clostridia bacterium]|nr:DUF975 family protein [Clostridia bacterium]
MTRIEIKEKAKAQLGGKIFGSKWLIALVVDLIVTVILGAGAGVTLGLLIIVLTGVMNYGHAYVYLKNARDGEQMEIGDVFKGFNSDFGDLFLLGFMQSLFIALWSILLVVPGIVKSYSYAMAYYLKVDHPEMNWKDCITESRNLMQGHKWELFVLDLSFIGWYIVGALCLGVGTLWVSPYHNSARALFYESIKH